MYGVDISDYQAGFNVGLYAVAGHEFIILKASEGRSWRSRTMHPWREAAHNNGLALVGLYHFLHANDPQIEARNFLAQIGQLRPGEVAICDWEEPKNEAPASADQARAWLEIVEDATGRVPILYSGPGFLTPRATTSLLRWPLWVASYGRNTGQEPATLPNTDRWARLENGLGPYPHRGRTIMWQFTDKGRVAGHGDPLDLNRFDGSEEDLLRLGGRGKTPTKRRHEMFICYAPGGVGLLVMTTKCIVLTAGEKDILVKGGCPEMGSPTETMGEEFVRQAGAPDDVIFRQP